MSVVIVGGPNSKSRSLTGRSHIMVTGAVQEAEKNNICIARSHSSSSSALKRILAEHCC